MEKYGRSYRSQENIVFISASVAEVDNNERICLKSYTFKITYGFKQLGYLKRRAFVNWMTNELADF